MRTAFLIPAGLAALALGACTPPHVRHSWGALTPVSRLECPTSQGQLSLKTASKDGTSCAYMGDDGAQVDVNLVPAPNGPDVVLANTETDLRALLPPPPPEPDTPPAESSAPASDPHAKNVNIRLPGINIHAGDEKANISIGSLHIDADDSTDTVHMRGGHGGRGRGQFTIDASHGGAVIRAEGGGRDVRSTLILASDQTGPQGWHVVGYEARGPRSGPLVVATVRSKSDEHDATFADVKALVRRSAGA